jgi:hypothetical protein
MFLAITGCAYAADYIGPEADTRPVRLRITNADTDQALRCLLSMAHFITRDIALIAAGDHIDIDLQRGVDSGTLYYREDATPLMAVENMYCGTDRAWAETKMDLDLSALRRGGGISHTVVCRTDGALVCRAGTDG